MISDSDRPLVGVASLIINEGRILLGYRTKTPGKNSWQCPGGLLEKGETIFECAIRECREETGLDISELTPGPYTNNYFKHDDSHSITLYVVAGSSNGQIATHEPDRACNWSWFAKDQIPEPLFLPLQLLITEQRDFWNSLFR